MIHPPFPADGGIPVNADTPEPKSLAPSVNRGRLVIAGNTLGNPEDIPPRALQLLREADLVIFEEAKGARRTLKAAGIHRDYLLYSEHKEAETMAALREALSIGQTVIYMSDQGMPAVADPGRDLLREAYNRAATVDVIPGPSSITTAMAVCPYECEPFTFLGLLPRSQAERQRALARVRTLGHTLIILDTPYRLEALLTDAEAIFGARHPAFIALDISGPGQMFWKGVLVELLAKVHSMEEKKNFVLIIPGKIKFDGSKDKSGIPGSMMPGSRVPG